MSFYNGKNDGNIKNDIVQKEFDMYVSAIVYQGNVDVDNSTPATTVITPVNTYDTTNDAGKTIAIENKTYTIDSVDGSTWTIDTSVDNLTGNTTSVDVIGKRQFFGLTTGKALTDSKEYKEFEYQGDLIRKDLKKRTISLKGTSKTQSYELIKELFGMKEQSNRDENGVTYLVASAGSNPSAKNRWQLELVGANVNCKTIIYRLFNCELNNDGDVALDPDEYTEVNFTADVFVDYPRKSDSTTCGGVEDGDLYEYLVEE